LNWNLYYAYGRWRPEFWISTGLSTSFFAGPVTPAGEPQPVTRRQRQVESGVRVPFVHARVSHVALGSVLRSADEFTSPDSTSSRNRAAVRGGWSTATARFYGYSISPERGIRAGGTAEAIRRAFGSSAGNGSRRSAHIPHRCRRVIMCRPSVWRAARPAVT
jgi:hypothetical protein